MTKRIHPDKLLESISKGVPLVPSTVLEEKHLLTSQQMRTATRRGVITASKVGSLWFYNADAISQKAEEIRQLSCVRDRDE